MTRRMIVTVLFTALMAVVLTACNLVGSPEEPLELTDVPTNTPGGPTAVSINATRTTAPTVTSLPFITRQPPTAFFPPTSIAFATATPSTSAIVIFSPVPGSVVSGNVSIFGSATHPNFLQYQLEYGPDPNFSNLWYPIGTANIRPVLNNVLGTWSTNGVPDGVYALRMRVFLRDGSQLQTLVNGIRVQNTAPTPRPSNTPTIPRPIAAFTQDRISGDVPLTVRFFNQSSGQITGYQWRFGDGSTSSEVNPTYTFRSPGIFTVTLTVDGPGGRSNVARTITVNQGQPPIANFTHDPRSGPAPLTVRFTDTSTGTINQRTWYFGDGSTSNQQNPAHTYQQVGEYNVILEVRGPSGATQRTRKVIVTQPNIPAPVASFTTDVTSGDRPLIVKFNNTSTGQINSYIWEFGDGKTSVDPSPVHLYETDGTFDVTLTVSGPGGQSSATGRITVNRPVQAPDANFTANPEQGEAPLRVQFTNASSGDISRYEWNFGDGTALGTQPNPEHTYQTAGTFTVRLTVFGPNNTSDFMERTISVTEPVVAPDASFEASPEQGTAPLEVRFTNTSSGTRVTYMWDFGDGGTSDSQETLVTHTYQSNGTYTVRLTAVGPEGESDFAERTITVTNALDASFTTAVNDLTAQFTDTSTGNITGWQWDFGDGGTSTDQSPSHDYTNAGTYQVRLRITDGSNSDEATQEITVTDPVPDAPTAGFSVTVNDRLVDFTDTSSGTVDSWAWDFGDGGTSTDQNPQHTYAAAGTYPVTLTVSNAGGSNSISQNVTVTDPLPGAPAAGFTAQVTDLTARFTDTSSGTVDSWAWDFGDGGTSVDQNPEHVYGAAGTYPVTLVVTNAGGSNSITQNVTVTEPAGESIADTTEVRPNIGDLAGRLSSLLGAENRADVFAVIGDRTADAQFMKPFGDGDYRLDNLTLEALQPVYDRFSVTEAAGGQNSFDRAGVAVRPAMNARELITQPSGAPDCDASESTVDCELRLTKPGVVFISVGYRDARTNVELGEFRGAVEQIVDRVVAAGAIPVLMTPYPRLGEEDLMRPYAETIIEVAGTRQVPVFNVWRLFNELPGSGLTGEDPSVAPVGSDFLNDSNVVNFGANARHYHALGILKALMDQVLP